MVSQPVESMPRVQGEPPVNILRPSLHHMHQSTIIRYLTKTLATELAVSKHTYCWWAS